MLIAQWRQRLRPPTKPVQASLPLLQKAPKAQPQQKIYFSRVIKEMEEEYFGKESQRSRLRKAVMKGVSKMRLLPKVPYLSDVTIMKNFINNIQITVEYYLKD